MEDNCKTKTGEKKINFRPNIVNPKDEKVGWILIITLAAFFSSTLISMISSKILQNVSIVIAFVILFIVIVVGVVFDMIGIAVTAADEKPFHAMASRKVAGSKQSIILVRNANKVSSFCNDVVGDICGVLSGSLGAFIVLMISRKTGLTETAYLGFIITGIIAALTIGGKAVGKTIAIRKSNFMVYRISLIIKFFTGRTVFSDSRRK